MATYATQADFEAYVPGWTTEDPAALEDILQKAEQDIDTLFFGVPGDTGLKQVPADLEDVERTALSRATCAQAEYRMHMGPAFFIEGPNQARGGDIEYDKPPPYVGHKARQELLNAGMLKLTGRLV